jgi:hypothetical protein
MHQHTRSRASASDAGRARAGNTNGESKVRCLEREGMVGLREEEQRWQDGEQEGWSSPRCRIETALNPSRTQTKEKGRYENRDYSTREAMGRWEVVRVEGR